MANDVTKIRGGRRQSHPLLTWLLLPVHTEPLVWARRTKAAVAERARGVRVGRRRRGQCFMREKAPLRAQISKNY